MHMPGRKRRAQRERGPIGAESPGQVELARVYTRANAAASLDEATASSSGTHDEEDEESEVRLFVKPDLEGSDACLWICIESTEKASAENLTAGKGEQVKCACETWGELIYQPGKRVLSCVQLFAS